MKSAVVKLALRRAIRKARRAKDFERVELFTQVIDDPDLLDVVALAADAQYSYETGAQLTQGFGDGWTDFLAWILEQLGVDSQFVAFILEILGLLFRAEAEED